MGCQKPEAPGRKISCFQKREVDTLGGLIGLDRRWRAGRGGDCLAIKIDDKQKEPLVLWKIKDSSAISLTVPSREIGPYVI